MSENFKKLKFWIPCIVVYFVISMPVEIQNINIIFVHSHFNNLAILFLNTQFTYYFFFKREKLKQIAYELTIGNLFYLQRFQLVSII